MLIKYENDIRRAFPYESTDGTTDVVANVKEAFIVTLDLDDSMGGKGVPNIAGYQKLDDYTVQVTIEVLCSRRLQHFGVAYHLCIITDIDK